MCSVSEDCANSLGRSHGRLELNALLVVKVTTFLAVLFLIDIDLIVVGFNALLSGKAALLN